MKIAERECLKCEQKFAGIPLLRCGHFICPKCYCYLKTNRDNQHSNKCGCVACGKNMVRKCRI